jgi:hypothetical protein
MATGTKNTVQLTLCIRFRLHCWIQLGYSNPELHTFKCMGKFFGRAPPPPPPRRNPVGAPQSDCGFVCWSYRSRSVAGTQLLLPSSGWKGLVSWRYRYCPRYLTTVHRGFVTLCKHFGMSVSPPERFRMSYNGFPSASVQFLKTRWSPSLRRKQAVNKTLRPLIRSHGEPLSSCPVPNWGVHVTLNPEEPTIPTSGSQLVYLRQLRPPTPSYVSRLLNLSPSAGVADAVRCGAARVESGGFLGCVTGHVLWCGVGSLPASCIMVLPS